MSNNNLLGRRNFIKGIGAAAGVAMAAPTMAISEKAEVMLFSYSPQIVYNTVKLAKKRSPWGSFNSFILL